MKKALYLILIILASASTTISFTSCRKEVGTTSVLVLDSIRHYYPVVMGEELEMVYRIANIGTEPLVITDIQPSCGCVVSDGETETIIPPGEESRISFKFDTNKNVGYVRHTIHIFGNIKPDGQALMTFDCNIVPPTNASVDYEENWHERKAKEIAIKGLVDGTSGQKGYWTDAGHASRSHAKYPWQERGTQFK